MDNTVDRLHRIISIANQQQAWTTTEPGRCILMTIWKGFWKQCVRSAVGRFLLNFGQIWLFNFCLLLFESCTWDDDQNVQGREAGDRHKAERPWLHHRGEDARTHQRQLLQPGEGDGDHRYGWEEVQGRSTSNSQLLGSYGLITGARRGDRNRLIHANQYKKQKQNYRSIKLDQWNTLIKMKNFKRGQNNESISALILPASWGVQPL